MLKFTPTEAAAADRCPNIAQVPVSADRLRLARPARVLSWITLTCMGIEGRVAIIEPRNLLPGDHAHPAS